MFKLLTLFVISLAVCDPCYFYLPPDGSKLCVPIKSDPFWKTWKTVRNVLILVISKAFYNILEAGGAVIRGV